MTKLSIARILGECSLGGGCVAGGVEAAKVGVKVKDATKELKQKNTDLEKERKQYKDKYDEANTWNQNLKKENEGLKAAVEYSISQFHNIYVHNGNRDEIKNHGKDAKHGIKDKLKEGDKASNYAESLNWN